MLVDGARLLTGLFQSTVIIVRPWQYQYYSGIIRRRFYRVYLPSPSRLSPPKVLIFASRYVLLLLIKIFRIDAIPINN
jgi:hypothetical protein